MKKFMKTCAIIALVLFIARVAMAVTAGTIKGTSAIGDVVESVTGGKVHVNLDNLADNWGVFIGEGDSGENGGYYNISEQDMFSDDYEILEGDVKQDYPGEEIHSLIVEVSGCTLTLEPTEEENYYVEANDIGKFQCYEEDGVLYLKASQTVGEWKNINKASKEHAITLYVPIYYSFQDLSVNLGAGIVDMSRIRAQNLDMEVGAGQINVDGIEACTCQLNAGMGEIVLKDMAVENMQAETGMGHLELSGSILESAEVQCSMGAVEMYLSGSEKDYNYEVSAAMGSVTLGGKEYSGFSEEKEVDNGADVTLQLDCAMGSIDVTFAD